MAISFDPDKDAINLAKHGVSFSRVADFDLYARVYDARYAEPRFRAYGLLDGETYCLAYVMRDGDLRAISFRRAHAKEYYRYVRKDDPHKV